MRKDLKSSKIQKTQIHKDVHLPEHVRYKHLYNSEKVVHILSFMHQRIVQKAEWTVKYHPDYHLLLYIADRVSLTKLTQSLSGDSYAMIAGKPRAIYSKLLIEQSIPHRAYLDKANVLSEKCSFDLVSEQEKEILIQTADEHGISNHYQLVSKMHAMFPELAALSAKSVTGHVTYKDIFENNGTDTRVIIKLLENFKN